MPTTDSTTLKDRKTRQPVLSLIGHRYGLLTVQSETSRKGRNRRYVCECDCGRFTVAHMVNLRSGGTRSCGCLRVTTMQTHGYKTGGYVSPTYATWKNMRQRCRPGSEDFQNYGGRGITVCERWQKFENFLADMGERPGPLYSLDRIDNNGNYESSNCRWATRTEQNRNSRHNRRATFNGENKTISEWAERTGIDAETISYRLKVGWAVELALTTPPLPASECFKLRKS